MHALQNCKVWDLVFFPRFIWLLKLKVTLAELCLLCPHNAGSDCQEFVFLPIPPRWWLHFSKVFQCFHPTKWGTWAFGVPKNLSENLQCQTMFISNTEMLSAFSLSSHSQWWYRINRLWGNFWPSEQTEAVMSTSIAFCHTTHSQEKGSFLRTFMMRQWVVLLLLKSQSLSIHILNISCDKMRSNPLNTFAAYRILKAKHLCDCLSCELN